MFNLVAQAYGWSLGMCHGLCPSLPHHLRRSTLGAAEVKQPRHIKFLRPQPKHLKFMAFSVKPKLSFHWLLESAAQNLRAALEKWWQGSISQEVLQSNVSFCCGGPNSLVLSYKDGHDNRIICGLNWQA
jgi:hypothetical protein